MSTCDSCRSPGNCCKGFVLNWTFSVGNWREEASQLMTDRGLPFVPVRPKITYGGRLPPGKTGVMFDCTLVDDAGRCSDYENRPFLCRHYQAGEDQLCAEYVHTLRGIPIRVEHAPAA